MELKRCSKCGIEKPKTEFPIKEGESEPYRNTCKQCISAKGHDYYLRHQDIVMANSKAYYEANKEQVKTYHHEHYRANKEEISKQHASYNAENKESIAKRKAERYQETKPERAASRAATPKLHWTRQTVGHHGLKGKQIRDNILAMAEVTIFCPICNCKLKYGGGNPQWHSASMDRKHNDDSTNIDDFWIICRHCNLTKRERSMEEMDLWCVQWQEARQERKKNNLATLDLNSLPL